jgi:mono/diheme cytochrome c family protein
VKSSIRVAAAVIATAVAGVGLYTLVTPQEVRLDADPTNLAQVAVGEKLYRAHCASCHGRALEGEENWRQQRADGSFPAPPHDETGHTWHHADGQLFDITKRGGAVYNPRSAMPGFGGTLGDDEIWSILAYIKSRWPEPVQARQRTVTLAADER